MTDTKNIPKRAYLRVCTESHPHYGNLNFIFISLFPMWHLLFV